MAVVIGYSEQRESMMTGDYILVILTSSVLVTVCVIISMFLAKFLTGKIEKILQNLKDVFSLKEYSALEKGSAMNAFNMIVNSFEYYRERRSEDLQAKRDLSVMQAQKAGTLNIYWSKPRDAGVFQLSVPSHWRNTYPGLNLPEKAYLFDYLQPETLSQVKSAFSRAEETDGRDINIKTMLRVSRSESGTNDEWAWILITGRSVKNDNDDIVTAGMIIDESRIRLIENTVKEYRSMYSFAVQTSEDIIYEVDISADRLNIITPDKFESMLGLNSRATKFSEFRSVYLEAIDPDYREGFLDRFYNFDHLALFSNKTMSYEYRIKNANGDYIWINHTVCAVGIDDSRTSAQKHGQIPYGAVTKVISRINDMNEQRKRREGEDGRVHDGLTGAYLKNKLREEFTRMVKDIEKSGEQKEAVPVLIVADIDGFRLINDLHGRETGDKLLMEVVLSFWENQIQSCAVARTGGDEFAMLVKEMQAGEGYLKAEEIAQRILRKFEKPIKVDGSAVNISLSVGIAYHGSSGEEFDEVYGSAITALRKAAEKGVNKFEVHLK